MSKTSAITERRIRPIYDFLDLGNHKRAIQEADKLLKKSPDFLCAKALKALSLIRSGKINEADQLIFEVVQAETDDEFTLQSLSYCYRDLGQPEKITQLYEKALKKQPNNEEYLSHVMMAYARSCHFKKQKQYAMQLYKLRPEKNIYYFWTVMATVMQCSEDTTSQSTFLTLSEKMMEKYFTTNKISGEAEIKLYTLILEMAEKYGDELNFLENEKVQEILVDRIYLDQKIVWLMEKLDKQDEIYDLCQKKLVVNPDDWFSWTNLLQSGLKIIDKNSDLKQSIIDQITKLILESVNNSKKSDFGVTRGPHLARFQFIKLLIDRGHVIRSQLGDPNDLTLQYFKLFGNKPSCLNDLKPYLHIVLGSELLKLEENLEAENAAMPLYRKMDEYLAAQNVTVLRRHICSLYLMWSFGVYNPVNQTKELRLRIVNNLLQYYIDGLSFGTELISTDLQYSDDYLLLAVYTLWQIYIEEDDPMIVMDILSILEFGLSKSQASFKMKLMLVKVYNHIGCCEGLQQSIDVLQLKYIMRESLWYLVADGFSPFGFFDPLLQWCSASLQFYQQADKEMSESVVQCYKSATFDRIHEFLDFKQKIQNSAHRKLCFSWQKYFRLVLELDDDWKVDNLPELSSPIDFSQLSDNRDFAIFDFAPIDLTDQLLKEIDNRKSASFVEMIEEGRFIDSISHVIYSILSIDNHNIDSCKSNSPTVATVTTNGEMKNDEYVQQEKTSLLLKSIDEQLEKCKALYRHTVDSGYSNTDSELKLSLYGPPMPSAFYTVYNKGSYFEVLNAYLTATVGFLKSVNLKEELVDFFNPVSSPNMQAMFKSMFSNHQLRKDGHFFPYSQIVHISFLVQTNSLLLCLLKHVRHTVANVTNILAKKSKKKKPSADSTSTNIVSEQWMTSFNEAAMFVFQSIDTTSRLGSDLSAIIETGLPLVSIKDKIIHLTEFDQSRQIVGEKLNCSYGTSLKNLQQLVDLQLNQIRKLVKFEN